MASNWLDRRYLVWSAALSGSGLVAYHIYQRYSSTDSVANVRGTILGASASESKPLSVTVKTDDRPFKDIPILTVEEVGIH